MIGAFRNWSTGVREGLAARPDRVRRGVEAALVLILAVQAGRLVWLFLEPAPTPSPVAAPPAAPPVDPSVFERFDAFFRTGGQGSLAEATAAGASQMRLYGVRSDGGGGGSAIIGLADGRQVSVAVGEPVEPGLVLQTVAADHVVLARGASLTRLIFSDVPAGIAPSPPPPSTPRTVTPEAPTPAPASSAADIAASAGLRDRLSGRSAVDLRIERDGVEQTLTLGARR